MLFEDCLRAVRGTEGSIGYMSTNSCKAHAKYIDIGEIIGVGYVRR